jgi:aldehyde dehydrogenase (NAD+)
MIAILDRQKIVAEQLEEVNGALVAARAAQNVWAQRPAAARARLIGELRPLLAAEANTMAEITGVVGDRPVAEKLVSEVLPLLDACRFLQKNAASILRPQRFGRRAGPSGCTVTRSKCTGSLSASC